MTRRDAEALLTTQQRAEDPITRMTKLRVGLASWDLKFNKMKFDESQALAALDEANVQFAHGNSDSDSIRDPDTGTGRCEWREHEAYFFKVTPNPDYPSKRYRRVMVPQATLSRLATPENPVMDLSWKPLVASDSDGNVDQNFFTRTSEEIQDYNNGKRPQYDKDGNVTATYSNGKRINKNQYIAA